MSEGAIPTWLSGCFKVNGSYNGLMHFAHVSSSLAAGGGAVHSFGSTLLPKQAILIIQLYIKV